MLIDSHCHLDHDVFDTIRDELIQSCLENGVGGFLVPATKRAGWTKLQYLADRYPTWRAAYGVHPYFIGESECSDIEFLGDQCESQCAVAVGEIGLDNWPGSFNMSTQMLFFKRQLQVAKTLKLPVIVHARKSYDLVLKCLREVNFNEGGIIHAFNGSIEQAKRLTELGFLLGIGGTVTYPRAHKAHRVLASLNGTDFLLETDSPDMPLYGFQGKNNTPLSIPLVAQSVADIRGESVGEVAAQTYENLLRVFPGWNEDLL